MKICSKEGYLIKKNDYINIIDEIKKELTVTPHLSFNLNIKPKSFPVYLENKDYLCLPKFYGLNKFGKPDINKEILGESINIIFNGELRQKQKDVINIILPKLESDDGGLLCEGCGEGKTIKALYIACHFKKKTLVIVHKTFLLNQWIERIKEFTNASVGIIRGNQVDIDGKDIVIGMLQSIAKDKYISETFEDFGLVIFDEAHHAPSKYFSKALPIIASKKTLALSATPKRSDKLEKVLYWYFGNILYKSQTKIIDNVLVKVIKYTIIDPKFKEYKQNYGKEFNRAKTINKLTEIDNRNNFIIETIIEIINNDDNNNDNNEKRKILILSDRIEHLNILKNIIDTNYKLSTGFYIGGLKQKILTETEKATIIFGSYSMASEGLDIPNLNTLIMVTPRKEIEQAIGRILRKDHTIQPLIIDIVDQLPSFIKQSIHRIKFYKKKGFIIKYYDIKDNKIIKEYIESFNDVNNYLLNDEFID
jgi:superfamily II DNA or RNA helicase